MLFVYFLLYLYECMCSVCMLGGGWDKVGRRQGEREGGI